MEDKSKIKIGESASNYNEVVDSVSLSKAS